MAGTAAAATRKRPRKTTNTSTNGEAVNDEVQTNDEAADEVAEPAKSEGRAKALYHLYEEDEDGTLHKLGDDPDKKYEGRNASEAIETYIDEGNDAEGITFVVVPDRNLARVKADVETKTKVKLSPA